MWGWGLSLSDLVWSTVFMSGSVCLVAAWVCWLTFRNAYLGLLLVLLLLPFNLQVIVELWVAKVLLVFFWDSFIWTGWIGSSSFIHVCCLLVIFERLHNFSVTIPDVLKISMSALTFVLQAVFNFQFFSLHCHIFLCVAISGFVWGCTHYSNMFDFSVTIPRVSKDVNANSFLVLTDRLCRFWRVAFIWLLN